MNVEKFMQIFRGSDLGYGIYTTGEETGKGKLGGKALTLQGKTTKQQWKDHLNGKEPSLGIIPINENNECYWGCIDIDEYPIDHKNIAKKIKNLPLIMCRSKSGGAHIFLFSKGPVQAKSMRKTLENLASGIGHSSSEIFPKQDFILLERGDVGNFLNLPFHNVENSIRYSFKEDGTASTLEEFFILYDKKAIEPQQINNIKIKVKEELLPNGPPCLQHLCSQSFPQGSRNLGLFNLGVYARKAFPDDWEKKVEEYNQKYMKPSLGYKEITTLIKSLQKTTYNYKCKDDPIKPHCNADVCRTRKHGVGCGYTPNIGNLTKLNTEPPLWFLNMNGQRIELETEELQNQYKFQRVCMNQINKMPALMRPAEWTNIVQALYEDLTIMDAPPEAGITGQFKDLLKDFCTSIGQAETKEEILLNRPYTEKGKTYFKLADLENFLNQHNFKKLGRNKIVSILQNMKAKDIRMRIEGSVHRMWFIPEYTKDPEIPDRKMTERKDPF